MAGAVAWRGLAASATAVREVCSVGLRDQSGNFLPGLIVGDRWFVIGEEGRRYSIVVRNRSELRLRNRAFRGWARCHGWPPGFVWKARLSH